MISSMPNASAVRSGERKRCSFSSISRPARSGIGRRFDFALVRRLHAAFDRQRSPIAGRPRVAQVERLRVAVTRARYSVAAANQDRDPRHGRLIDRDQRARTGANGSRALRRAADQKTRDCPRNSRPEYGTCRRYRPAESSCRTPERSARRRRGADRWRSRPPDIRSIAPAPTPADGRSNDRSRRTNRDRKPTRGCFAHRKRGAGRAG